MHCRWVKAERGCRCNRLVYAMLWQSGCARTSPVSLLSSGFEFVVPSRHLSSSSVPNRSVVSRCIVTREIPTIQKCLVQVDFPTANRTFHVIKGEQKRNRSKSRHGTRLIKWRSDRLEDRRLFEEAVVVGEASSAGVHPAMHIVASNA